jgi:plastocyanin
MQERILAKRPSSVAIPALVLSLVLAGLAAWQASSKTQAEVITFVNFSYSPAIVTIRSGEEVTWQGDFSSHPLVSQDGLWPTVGSGTEFSYAFTQPGEYWYYCGFHGGPNGTGMSGKVTVFDEQVVFLPFINR